MKHLGAHVAADHRDRNSGSFELRLPGLPFVKAYFARLRRVNTFQSRFGQIPMGSIGHACFSHTMRMVTRMPCKLDMRLGGRSPQLVA